MVGFPDFDLKTDWWIEEILAAAAHRPNPVEAHTFLDRRFTSSDPVLLACEDGQEYFVKAAQAGRMIITDQVVGQLGRQMGAPVGEVRLVNVPRELVDAEPQMSHMPSGVAHGCLRIPACSSFPGIVHTATSANRPRFALLSILYGWAEAFDHQFLYDVEPPHRVHSVDHGHFLPGGPNWTTTSLLKGEFCSPDATIVGACHLKLSELHEAAVHLHGIDDAHIATAVAQPPDSWGMRMPERVALAQFLSRRRHQLLESFLAERKG